MKRRMASRPPADPMELRVSWDGKEESLMYHARQRPDGMLVAHTLETVGVYREADARPLSPDTLPLFKALERRGYDMTTLRFSVLCRDDEHAWIRHGRVLYPRDNPHHRFDKPLKVDWVRYRGHETTVFFASPQARRDGEPPLGTWNGSLYLGGGAPIAEVELRYQPTPAEPPEWTPDNLPPMFPEVP